MTTATQKAIRTGMETGRSGRRFLKMKTAAVSLCPLMKAIHSCSQGSRVTRTDLSSFSSVVDRSCLKRAILAIGPRRQPLMFFVICALAADTQCPMYLDV